jgi:hypothetical protein
MIAMKTAFPATHELAVAAFEKKIDVRLPEDYRRFLLACNGGEPVDGEFAVAEWGATVIHFFFGLSTGERVYDLDWRKEKLADVFPASVIAIASDPGGYLVALGVRGKAEGKVYFWDRGDKLEQLVRIAPSFDSFLSSLKPDGTFGPGGTLE